MGDSFSRFISDIFMFSYFFTPISRSAAPRPRGFGRYGRIDGGMRALWMGRPSRAGRLSWASRLSWSSRLSWPSRSG